MTPRSVEEWVGKTPETPIPPRVQLRIMDRQNCRCNGCGRELGLKLKAQFDHRPALINGGEHRESKIVAVCAECHSERTADDVAEKSETYHMRAKHLGIELKQKRGFGRW